MWSKSLTRELGCLSLQCMYTNAHATYESGAWRGGVGGGDMLWLNNEVKLPAGRAESSAGTPSSLTQVESLSFIKPSSVLSQLQSLNGLLLSEMQMFWWGDVSLEYCCLDLIHPDGMHANPGVVMKSWLKTWRIVNKLFRLPFALSCFYVCFGEIRQSFL